MDEAIKNRIVEELKKYFGDKPVSVILFGSQARGAANEYVIAENAKRRANSKSIRF